MLEVFVNRAKVCHILQMDGEHNNIVLMDLFMQIDILEAQCLSLTLQ